MFTINTCHKRRISQCLLPWICISSISLLYSRARTLQNKRENDLICFNFQNLKILEKKPSSSSLSFLLFPFFFWAIDYLPGVWQTEILFEVKKNESPTPWPNSFNSLSIHWSNYQNWRGASPDCLAFWYNSHGLIF